MKNSRYGRNIDFSYVIRTKKYVSVFIPQKFPWEEEEKAEIILNDKYKIIADMQAELLIKTDKGIDQQLIPFERTDDKYICDLPVFLEENGIRMEKAGGRCCDGTKWNQKDFTEKVYVCRQGMLSLGESPYWGDQYEFYFADEDIRPRLGGKDIKILRFSYCDKSAWERMESAFRTMSAGKVNWDINEFNCLLRYVGVWYENKLNKIKVFMEDNSYTFDWTDISNLF